MERFVAITVQPNTTEDNAIETIIPLQKGNIEHINVIFPAGCAALVYVQIFCHAEQISPWNKTGVLKGNDVVIQAVKNYPVSEPPYEVIVKVWSDDDTYSHTPLVDIMEVDEVPQSVSELLLGLK